MGSAEEEAKRPKEDFGSRDDVVKVNLMNYSKEELIQNEIIRCEKRVRALTVSSNLSLKHFLYSFYDNFYF